jgi:hypothetical protein
MFALSFNTDSAAFDDGFPLQEAARILRHAAEELEKGQLGGRLRDYNGNAIGHFSFNGADWALRK